MLAAPIERALFHRAAAAPARVRAPARSLPQRKLGRSLQAARDAGAVRAWSEVSPAPEAWRSAEPLSEGAPSREAQSNDESQYVTAPVPYDWRRMSSETLKEMPPPPRGVADDVKLRNPLVRSSSARPRGAFKRSFRPAAGWPRRKLPLQLLRPLTLGVSVTPQERLERLGTGWMGAIFEFEGVVVEDCAAEHREVRRGKKHHVSRVSAFLLMPFLRAPGLAVACRGARKVATTRLHAEEGYRDEERTGTNLRGRESVFAPLRSVPAS